MNDFEKCLRRLIIHESGHAVLAVHLGISLEAMVFAENDTGWHAVTAIAPCKDRDKSLLIKVGGLVAEYLEEKRAREKDTVRNGPERNDILSWSRNSHDALMISRDDLEVISNILSLQGLNYEDILSSVPEEIVHEAVRILSEKWSLVERISVAVEASLPGIGRHGLRRIMKGKRSGRVSRFLDSLIVRKVYAMIQDRA